MCCGDTHGRNGWEKSGGDRLELGSLSGDSQEYFSDLPHAGKTSYFAASSTQTFLSLSSGEAEFYGAVRCACRTLGLKSLMSDLSLEVTAELVFDSSACKEVVFQTWCGENSTHPLSCIVASTRRGTTRDCDYPECGKRLSSRCRDKGGHPRGHHVATAGHVWTGQGRRSSEASVEHGRSASGGLRTWLRYVCTTFSELQFERGSLFPCSLD